MAKTYLESANTIPIYDECDILVVGGGSAGHSAAIAAARAGNKNIILMERYGYCGGDVTGGYVLMVPKLSWHDKSFVRGLQEEWFTRIQSIPNALLGPGLDEIGDNDPVKLLRWKAVHGCVAEGDDPYLVRALYYEPTQLKIEMELMLLEHKDAIRVCYHSLGTKPIVEDGQVKGVIFESKEGRQAILAKTVIDATGDGDLFSRSGAPFEQSSDKFIRSSATALVWRIGGCDLDQYNEWCAAHPAEARDFVAGMAKTAGYQCAPFIVAQHDLCWVNNWHRDRDCAKIKDLTETEINTRATIRQTLDYMKRYCPVAFRDAYIYDIAPQLGARCSRRLTGEYVMTAADWAEARQHDDVIAWHSTICRLNDCGPVEIPYRAILPRGVENLLCPGRHMSADQIAIDWLTLIPQCVGTGQAAGVASAVAVETGTSVRDVDIRRVQDILVDQDVPLPRNDRVDPSYTECCEKYHYGLDAPLAQKARAEYGSLAEYRQKI